VVAFISGIKSPFRGEYFNENFGAAPVLDKTENLVGILSAIDLLRALKDSIDLQRKKSNYMILYSSSIINSFSLQLLA
jgi:CBS domain-containing protein